MDARSPEGGKDGWKEGMNEGRIEGSKEYRVVK